MSYTTDLINKRRGLKIEGSQMDGSQVDRKKSSEKLTFTQQIIEQRRQGLQDFSTARQNLSAEPITISQPQEERSFFKKASDFLGIGTGELKQGAIGLRDSARDFVADIGRRKQQGTLGSDIWQGTQNLYKSAKSVIVNEAEKERQKKKEYFGDDVDLNKLNYDQILKYESDSFLDIVKPDLEEDLRKLESKSNKSKVDNYRIKNIKESLRLVDEARNAPIDQRKKYETMITGMALSRSAGALTAGILNIGESFFDFVKWRGDVAGTEGISEFSEKAGDRVNAWADEVRPNNPQLADKLLEGVGSTLPFYVTGLGISSTTARLASVSPKMAQVIGVGSSAFMEAGLEAGTTYQLNIDRGMSHEEADKRASRVFAGNVLFNYFTDKVGLFNDGEGVKRFIMSGMGEGTQESWQNALQNLALDEDPTENIGETFMLSFITGAGLNSFGQVIQDPAVRQTLNEEDLKKLDAIDEAIRESNGDPQKFEQALEEKGVKTDQKQTEDTTQTKTEEVESTDDTQTPSPTDRGEVSPGVQEGQTADRVGESVTELDFAQEQEQLGKLQDQEAITKARSDIAQAEELMKKAPETADIDSGIKTKADYQRYINDVQQWLDKKTDTTATEEITDQGKESQEVQKADVVETINDIEKKYPETKIDMYEGDSEISLSRVVVPKEARNTGIGTRFMNDLIQYSDKVGKRIVLTPSSDFGGSKKRLVEFYKRFGFVENKGKNKDFSTRESMYRDPKQEKSPEKKPSKPTKKTPKKSDTKKTPTKKATDKQTEKKEVSTLPKDVSVIEESKAVGAKRIAPDRTVHQQLTPEASLKKLKSSISESIDILEKNRPVKASKNVTEQFDEVESKVERDTATEAEKKWYDRVKDQMRIAKAYQQLQDFVGDKKLNKTKLLEQAKEKLSSDKGVSNYYIRLIKKDISKGYKFPEAVIAYDRSFTKAESNRARYEKGLRTSFSADDERIVFDETEQISGGIKRQDGKDITDEQKQEIIDGVMQTQEALGINMNKIAEDERWVYSHLNGKNPFLTSQAGGLYRKTEDGNISISVGGVESFWTKENGKRTKKKVNTIVSHELGHALDHHTGQKIFPSEDIYKLRRSYNPLTNVPRSAKYWSSSSEIKARAIEQYVAIKNGHEKYYNREGYWKKEDFDSIIVPMVEQGIDKHFAEYKGEPTKPKQVLEVAQTTQEETAQEEKPIPKKELKEAEEKIVEKKEPEEKQEEKPKKKPEEKPKKKYEAQEGGKTKASKVAVSIEQKLGEKLENVAGFESINIKDQIKRAEDLLNKNLIRARGMISGKIPLPDGLRAGAFIKAVEVYAQETGDMSLLRSLAVSPLVSETSIHAQELRLLAERDENSVLSKIQEIANERAKIAERKYKGKVDKLIKEETNKIKKSIKKVDKHLWSDFIRNIEC